MKTLDLYITKVCNLNCEYCYVDLVNKEDDFEFSSFKSRINLLDYDHIKFFGGEPLIAWSNIKDIVNLVKSKKSKIHFTIVTNGILLNKDKVSFIKKNNIETVISVHKKGLKIFFDNFAILLHIKNTVGFSFIFEPNNITFPYKVISFLQKKGFKNFIISPEIYSDWNDTNLNKLKLELKKLLDIFNLNREIVFKGILGNSLKFIDYKCEKTVIDKTGKYYKCNRFKSLKQNPSINYEQIFKSINSIIGYDNDPYRWFYVCPIGFYFDHFNSKNFTYKVLQFKKLNYFFITFYKAINKLNGKLNFLSDSIKEIRFNLTSQCNLRCNYCYLDFENKKLDKKNAFNISDFHLSQKGEEKIISFFGGEPLLEFDLLKNIVNYSKEKSLVNNKSLSFIIATNFLLIDDKMVDFFIFNNFKFHISFNGKKEFNDKSRDFSTDLLLKKLKKYKEIIGPENITILLAFSNKDTSTIYNNSVYMYELGFKNINYEIILGDEYNWSNTDFNNLNKEFKKIRKLGINIMNLEDKHNFLDISVDGTSSENSISFYKNSVDFSNKKIFDKIALGIY